MNAAASKFRFATLALDSNYCQLIPLLLQDLAQYAPRIPAIVFTDNFTTFTSFPALDYLFFHLVP